MWRFEKWYPLNPGWIVWASTPYARMHVCTVQPILSTSLTTVRLTRDLRISPQRQHLNGQQYGVLQTTFADSQPMPSARSMRSKVSVACWGGFGMFWFYHQCIVFKMWKAISPPLSSPPLSRFWFAKYLQELRAPDMSLKQKESVATREMHSSWGRYLCTDAWMCMCANIRISQKVQPRHVLRKKRILTTWTHALRQYVESVNLGVRSEQPTLAKGGHR